MARIDTLVNFVTDICNAVRNKTGKTDLIPLSELDTEIESIETGGSGTVPETGFVPTEWDSSGNIVKGDFYGKNVPSYYFASGTNGSNLLSSITDISFKDEEIGINGFGMYCFSGNSIKSIVLPHLANTSVTNIGYGRGMFNGNTKIVDVVFQSEGIFGSYVSSSTGVTNDTFAGCSNLKRVVLPSFKNTQYSLYSIDANMFKDCSALEDINLDDHITRIGAYAFSQCSKLPLTTLPSNLVTIEQSGFYFCQSLLIQSFPETLTTLGASAFRECIKITAGNLDNINSLLSYTFFGCTALTNVTFSDNLTQIGALCFQSTGIKNVTITSTAMTTIGSQAFYNCKSLTNVDLHSCTSLTSITTNVFYDCTVLENILLPDTISQLGTNAFRNTPIHSIVLYGLTTYTDSSATANPFYGCVNLKGVWIGNSVTQISRYLFATCTALTKIYINLPRATVSAFTGYSYGFRNVTNGFDVVICNDDEDFITREEFDDIDWSTYEEVE